MGKAVNKPQNIEGKLHRSLFQLLALNTHGLGAIARGMPINQSITQITR